MSVKKSSSYIDDTQSLDGQIFINIVETLSDRDLEDLCDATTAAIRKGGGFGWVQVPERHILERYWKGVLLVPERHLLLARIGDVVVGAAQLVEPTRHNEAMSFSAQLMAAFIAPYGRSRGAGRRLIKTAEQLAVEMGYRVLQIDIRETQTHAIRLFEDMGFKRWGVNPFYAIVDNVPINGYYYSKVILQPVANTA